MKPTILIDARFWDPKNGGLSKYNQGLIYNLAKIKPNRFNYVVLTHHCRPKLADNFLVVPSHVDHYSFKEQFLASIIQKYKPDLIHYLHFNHPLINFSPFIITIHDMIKHYFPDPVDTSHPPLIYQAKRIAYKIVFNQALTSSKHIITPSQSVKRQIIQLKPNLADKISPIYEGVFFGPEAKKDFPKLKLPEKFLVYVGNLYQHKNIGFLIKNINSIRSLGLDLVIINPQKPGLKWRSIFKENKIISYYHVSQAQLKYVYQKAYAFISPSLMEGFGLPVIESIFFDKPAILSDISVFKEITHNRMVYFSPRANLSLIKSLKKLKQNYRFYQKTSQNLKNYYNFKNTALKTYQVYQQMLNQ